MNEAATPGDSGVGEDEQGAGVVERPAGVVDDDPVATVLAVATDPARDDPDGRMKEQDRFDHALNQVHKVIPPPNVSQLVQQGHLDLLWRPAR